MKTQPSFSKIQKNGCTLYRNQGGAEIGVAGAKIIQRDGFAFRDLTGTGQLLPYEDWRLRWFRIRDTLGSDVELNI